MLQGLRIYIHKALIFIRKYMQFLVWDVVRHYVKKVIRLFDLSEGSVKGSLHIFSVNVSESVF